MAGHERRGRRASGQKAMAYAMHYPERQRLKAAVGRRARQQSPQKLRGLPPVASNRPERSSPFHQTSRKRRARGFPVATGAVLRTALRRPAVAAHERGLRAAWFLICKRYRPVRAPLALRNSNDRRDRLYSSDTLRSCDYGRYLKRRHKARGLSLRKGGGQSRRARGFRWREADLRL
jgi:hypothetical protein